MDTYACVSNCYSYIVATYIIKHLLCAYSYVAMYLAAVAVGCQEILIAAVLVPVIAAGY